MVARPSRRRIKLLQDLSDDDGVVARLGEVVAFGFCLLSFAFCGSGPLFVPSAWLAALEVFLFSEVKV